MRIKFVSTPTGQAPEWVRNAWIGVEVETFDTSGPNDILRGVKGGKADQSNIGGYKVSTKEAVEAVRKTNPEAAKWWDKNLPTSVFSTLVFGKVFCEVISD